MASKGYPADILAQVTDILAACKQIDPVAEPRADDDRRHEFRRQPESPIGARNGCPANIGWRFGLRPLALRTGNARCQVAGRRPAFAFTRRVLRAMRICHHACPLRPLRRYVEDTLEVARTILIGSNRVKTTHVYVSV